MTAWAPVALWLSRPWAENSVTAERILPRWMRLGPGWCVAGLGLLILLAGVFLTAHGLKSPGAGITATSSAARDTMLTTLTGFSAAAWHYLLPLIWTAGGCFLLGGLAATLLAAGGRWRAVLSMTAVTMVAMLFIAARGMSVLENYFSLKQLALTVNRCATPEATVVCAGESNDNPSLLFYLNREIHWLHAQPAREFASRELGIGRLLFMSDEEFTRQWNSTAEVYLICEDVEVDAWHDKLRLAATQRLGQSGTRVLLANRPPK